MRSLAAVLPIAAAALLWLPASAPAALPECPPDAPPDFTCVMTIDDHFVDDELCSFDIAIDAVGKNLYTPRFDRSGNLIGELYGPEIKVSLTGVESGHTATDRDVGLDKVTFHPDGSADILSTGLHFKLRVDGRTTVFRQIGLRIIHVDPDGEQTEEVIGGIFQPIDDFGPTLCEALAP